MTERRNNFPKLFEGGRKAAFTALLVLAIAEAGAQFASAWTIRAVIEPAGEPSLKLALMTGAFGSLGLAYWGRSVLAEAIGQNYVQDVRVALSRQAIQSAVGRGRLGTVTVRMSSDLLSLKNWVNLGVCGAVSGTLALIAGLAAAGSAIGFEGFFSAAAGPTLTIFLAALLARPLAQIIRLRRRARGLLSARTGDSVLSARIAATYGAFKRFIGPINRAGQKVEKISVREQAIVQLLKASSLLAIPLGVCLQVSWFGADIPASSWAGLLFALGLCASGTLTLSSAFEAFLERRIAQRKLQELEAQGLEAPRTAPQGQTRLRPSADGVILMVDGEEILGAREQIDLSRSDAVVWLGKVKRGESGVFVNNLSAEDVASKDWARRIAVVSPALPVPRGLLRDVLSAQSAPRTDRMQECLVASGIDLQDDALNGVIDPYKDELEEPLLARLRLARALAHRPLIVIVDDVWLCLDRELRRRVAAWAERYGTGLIWLEVY